MRSGFALARTGLVGFLAAATFQLDLPVVRLSRRLIDAQDVALCPDRCETASCDWEQCGFERVDQTLPIAGFQVNWPLGPGLP